jgi:plasmid stability protein
MPDFLIKDVPQDVIDRLAFRAAMERTSLEIEVHKALREAAEREPTIPIGSVQPLPSHRAMED